LYSVVREIPRISAERLMLPAVASSASMMCAHSTSDRGLDAGGVVAQRRLVEIRREVVGADRALPGKDHRPFDDVAEFAGVTGPDIARHGFGGGPVESGDGGAHGPIELAQEVVSQGHDVLGPFPERRDRDGENVHPVVEILAEGARADHVLQVAVGGGDDPDVGGQVADPAHTPKLPILEELEDLALDLQRHFADLVEEHGTARCDLEQALLGAPGVGEGALFVAEQFGFQQGGRHGGAVQIDERSRGAVALAMDLLRHQGPCRCRTHRSATPWRRCPRPG
jgi:hypothetical protein